MRVFSPKIVEDAQDVCVSARVEVETVSKELPGELWFRFPKRFSAFVTDEINGFAAALLPLAMTLGEDISLAGRLSPRLLRGMEEYQRVQCGWEPTRFRPVRIGYDRLQPSQAMPGKSWVGCSFSGGVDSFHSLRRHLPQNEAVRDYRISHCLMINGFDADSDIDDEGHFSNIQKSTEAVLTPLGVDLIVCRTNYSRFSDPIILKQSFGAMVTAPALVLGPAFSVFYVPSSYRFNEFVRDGSHLMLDHLIATESMQTVHDSSFLDRPGKTAEIADWSPTHKALRVCFNTTGYDEATDSVVNCGRCEKCVRTMVTLEILGKLDNYSTFSRKPGHLAIWKCDYGSSGSRTHAREIMALAWENHRWGIWSDYVIAIIVSKLIWFPKGLLQRVHLYFEEHSDFYAVNIRRLFPRLRRRAYWIR